MKLQRVIAKKTHCADVAAGRHRGGNVIGPADNPGFRDLVHVRHHRRLQRRLLAKRRLRFISTPIWAITSANFIPSPTAKSCL